jgi:hypothetical protein
MLEGNKKFSMIRSIEVTASPLIIARKPMKAKMARTGTLQRP